MTKFEKVLAIFEGALTAFYVFIILAAGSFSAEAFGVALGGVLGLALIPFIVAIIASRFSKEKNKRLEQWKTFIKIYPIMAILGIIGLFSR